MESVQQLLNYRRLLLMLVGAFCLGNADIIQGDYHVWWAIVQLPQDTVQKMIADTNVVFLPVPLEGLEPGRRPVLFELGQEYNCGPKFPKFLQENFMEFKFDIPYVGHQNGRNAVARNYKQVIYINNTLESESSRLVYKLNSSKPTHIEMTDTEYTIVNKAYELKAVAKPTGPWGNASDYPNFEAYKEIMSLSWFGDTDMKTCGVHHYSFADANLRPVELTLNVQTGILNGNFPTGVFILPGVAVEKLGVVEARINFTMTAPDRCE